jgi:hypothetical protein
VEIDESGLLRAWVDFNLAGHAPTPHAAEGITLDGGAWRAWA